ncbi:MAG: hypothetical protein R3321_02375 [Nitrososphaeraceae archaeon]|nr:hypothetical protein [Nitrososphaeraceae archaeon]
MKEIPKWAKVKLIGATIEKKKCGCWIPKDQFIEYGLFCKKHLEEIRKEQRKYDKWIQDHKKKKRQK